MGLIERKKYDKMLDVLYKEIHNETDAFDRMLEFLLVDNSWPFLSQFGKDAWFIDPNNAWLRAILQEYNKETVELLRSNWDDDLGDLYIDLQSQGSQNMKGQFLTPMNVCNMMTQMAIPEELRNKKSNILDPCCGTGRFFMTGFKVSPKSYYYGVDIDQRILHVALVNCAMHDIHGFLLHADSLVHEIGLDTPNGRYNWKFANQWESHWSDLKTMADDQIEEKLSDDIRVIETIGTLSVKMKDDQIQMDLIDINNPEAVARRRKEIQVKATVEG